MLNRLITLLIVASVSYTNSVAQNSVAQNSVAQNSVAQNSTTPDCRAPQVFTRCGSACTRTCEDPNPPCTKQCVERCQCPTGTPIEHDSGCITQAACPKDYWGGEWWEVPDPERKCGNGQESNADGKSCQECPPGKFNPDDNRRDTCLPCPLGKFADKSGMANCIECPRREGKRTSTRDVGAVSEDQCKTKAELFEGVYGVTIRISVTITGNLCGTMPFLWDVSRLRLYDLTFHDCSVAGQGDSMTTTMAVSFFNPTNFAFESYPIVKMLEAYREMINGYIAMGPHYAEKLFEAVNLSKETKWIGLTLNSDVLNIKNMRIVDYKAYIEQRYCSAGYHIQSDGSCKTEKDPNVKPIIKQYYVVFKTNEQDCLENTARQLIEWPKFSDYYPLPCLKDKSCDIHYQQCRKLDCDDDVRIFAKINSRGTKEIEFTNIEIDSNLGVEFTKEYYIESKFNLQIESALPAICGTKQQPKWNCKTQKYECDDCSEGYFVGEGGLCEPCPFSTYAADRPCSSCPSDTVTPFWGARSKNMCLKTDNKLAGHSEFDLKVDATVDICNMHKAKKEMDKICSTNYKIDDFKAGQCPDYAKYFADIFNQPIERTICKLSQHFSVHYDCMCKDAKRDNMQDIIDYVVEKGEEGEDVMGEAIVNAVCMLGKPFRELDDISAEDDCSKSEHLKNRLIEILFELRNLEFRAEEAMLIQPLMTALTKLPHMDFANFADASEAFMKRIGISDLNKLMGIRIGNNMKEFFFSWWSGITMNDFNFDLNSNELSYWCERSDLPFEKWMVKRECDKGCDNNECRLPLKHWCKAHKMYCKADDCNDCKSSFFYRNESISDLCMKCEYPEIENGTIVESNNYEARYECDDGYVLKDCHDRAKCHRYTAEIIRVPKCVKPVCEFPDVSPDGLKKTFDHNNPPENFHECRHGGWAIYKCKDGYIPHPHDRVASCDNNGNINYQRCVRQCEFKEEILNGKLVHKEEYQAWYECNSDDFVWAGQNRWDTRVECQWDDASNGVQLSNTNPMCVPKNKCKFPDELENGARREHREEDDGVVYWRYRCPDGYNQEKDNKVWCGGDNGETVMYELICYKRGATCDGNRTVVWPLERHGGNWDRYFKCSMPHKFVLRGDPNPPCGSSVLPTCELRICKFPVTSSDGNVIRDSIYTSVKKGNVYEDDRLTQGDYGRWAIYKCKSEYHLSRDYKVECGNDPSSWSSQIPKCISNNINCTEQFKKFKRDNVVLETATKYSALYRCEKGFEQREDNWSGCDESGTMIPPKIRCVKSRERIRKCEFAETMNNAERVEVENHSARYQCKKGFKEDHEDGWNERMWCDEYTGEPKGTEPQCYDEKYDESKDCDKYDGGDGKDNCTDNGNSGPTQCKLPEYIKFGELEESFNDMTRGNYRCYKGYVLENIDKVRGMMKESPESAMKLQGYGYCDNGIPKLPACKHRKNATGCDFPRHIPNGKIKSIHGNSAEYVCDEDYWLQSVNIRDGEKAFCRRDMSTRLPRCINWKLEFKLARGKIKDDGSAYGYVVMRKEVNGKWGDWMGICDDGFNNEAASAVCRTIDDGRKYQSGVMRSMRGNRTDVEFGITGSHCHYDDVNMYSRDCLSKTYGTKHLPCRPNEMVAVRCFPKPNGVEIRVKVVTKTRGKKVYCYPGVMKGGKERKVKDLNLKYEIGGLKEGGKISDGESWYSIEFDGDKKSWSRKNGAYVMDEDSKTSCYGCRVWMTDADKPSLLGEGLSEGCLKT
jgi:hypothetical protein